MDGDSIRELREDLGVSQQELARRLQVAHSTVYRWEHGQSTPSGEVLARLLRLQRLKDFQSEGRLLSLRDLTASEQPDYDGLPPWHEASSCIEPGHLSLITSPPRCGKTLTALRWSLAATRRHAVPIFYISTHWTPRQTLHHLRRAAEVEPGEALDEGTPFHLFQHDGKDLPSLLEELSRRMGEAREGSFVVLDWLQNLHYKGREPMDLVDRERALLRDLKIWAAQQGVFLLTIASQRGIARCEIESFPHYFELADSITVGSVQELRRRRVEFEFRDLHRGATDTFRFELPPKEEIARLREQAAEPWRVPLPPQKGRRSKTD